MDVASQAVSYRGTRGCDCQKSRNPRGAAAMATVRMYRGHWVADYYDANQRRRIERPEGYFEKARNLTRSNSAKNSMPWGSEAKNYPPNYPLADTCLKRSPAATVADNNNKRFRCSSLACAPGRTLTALGAAVRRHARAGSSGPSRECSPASAPPPRFPCTALRPRGRSRDRQASPRFRSR
jgi:hypothetical protein